MVEIEAQQDQRRLFSPYIRSVYKSAFSQKAITGRFLGLEKSNTQLEKSSIDGSQD